MDEANMPCRNHRTRVAAAALWAVVAAGLGLRLVVLLTYEADVDGDEAVVGLMALRIADHGERFASWPGRRYNGGAAINAYIGAASFRLFGPSALALKAPALLWSLATLLLGYRLARDFAGPRTAAWTLLLLALGPGTFCRWGAKAYLGTNATLINLAIVYAVFRSASGECRGAGRMGWPLAAGLLLALGFYTSPFALPTAATCALWGAWTRRGFVRRRAFWLGLGAFALAAAPWLARMRGADAAELSPRPSLASLPKAVARAAVKLPYFFGHSHRYFGADRLSAAQSLGAACWLAGLAVAGAWRFGRLHAFALMHVAVYFGAFALSAQDVQYLAPAYVWLALAVGGALAQATARVGSVRWAGWALGLALLATNAHGTLRLTTRPGRNGFDKYVYGNVQFAKLAAFLEANGLKRAYASSAIANLLTFETRREVVAASYDTAFADDVRQVARAGRCAYVFCTGSDYDRRLGRHLRRLGIDHAERTLGEWTVRYALAARVRPEDVDWRADSLSPFPDRVALWQAALRLEPWRPTYECRLLEAQAKAHELDADTKP